MPRFNFTFQEASPFITYTGVWQEGSALGDDPQALQYDGSFSVTQSADAKATFNFVGTAVSIFGALRGNHGGYAVNLDNLDNTTISLSNGKDAFKQLLWSAPNLEYKVHTVEVTNKPMPGKPYFDVDYISIEREIGRDGDVVFNVTLDDTNSFVRYTGDWESSTVMVSQNHNKTIQQATGVKSQLAISFQGCCIELYGLYANAAYTVTLDAESPVQMQGMDIDLKSAMWHPQTLLYLVDGLDESVNHTVTLTATNAGGPRPFFFDYAIVRSTSNFSSPDTPFAISSRPGASTPLIVGLCIEGTVLLVLIVAAFLLLRRLRQRRRQVLFRTDLLERANDKSAPPPTPWISLPSNRPPPAPPSTWQLSSVVSGWHRLPDERTETTAETDDHRQGLRGRSGTRLSSSVTSSTDGMPPAPARKARKNHQFIVMNPRHSQQTITSPELTAQERDAGVMLELGIPPGNQRSDDVQL